MAFLALGINHKTASVVVRERVAFTPEQLVEALQQLCRLTDSREAAILSTCNRSELYIERSICQRMWYCAGWPIITI